jgi:hypothetical protein
MESTTLVFNGFLEFEQSQYLNAVIGDGDRVTEICKRAHEEPIS